MRTFSPTILNFLKRASKDVYDDLAMVPKSNSCALPGDFLIFRYSLGVGPGSREQRLTMVVQPVTRDPRTGNLLLTALHMDPTVEYTATELENLYTTRGSLPEDSYRTYRLNRVWGPLFRLPRKIRKK